MLRALDGACDDTGEKADKERIKEKVLLRTLPAAVHVDDIAQRGKGEITDAHRRENIQAGGRIMQAEGIQQRSQRFAQKVEVFIIEQTAHAQRQRHDQTDAAHPFDAQTFQQQRRRPGDGRGRKQQRHKARIFRVVHIKQVTAHQKPVGTHRLGQHEVGQARARQEHKERNSEKAAHAQNSFRGGSPPMGGTRLLKKAKK